MAESHEILRVLALLGGAFPNFELREETGEVYCRLLADLPAPLLEAATLRHIATAKFFPTVAELREAAWAMSGQLPPEPMEAWGEVMRQMRVNGAPSGPRFSHPAIREVVEQMTWWALCFSDNPPAERARFLEAYEKVGRRQRDYFLVPEEVRQLTSGDLRPQLAERADLQ